MMILAIDWFLIIEKAILISVVIAVSLVIAMYETWMERKVAAFMQDRRGPNRAGPMGLLQPMADGLKLFMKEEIIPNASNKFLFIAGPGLAMLTAMMTSAVIPWGGSLNLFGRTISLQVADPDIGILFIFAVVSLGVYGIMIGGWFLLLHIPRFANNINDASDRTGLCESFTFAGILFILAAIFSSSSK